MLSKQHRLPIDGFPSKARTLLRGKVVSAKVATNTLGLLRVGVLSSRKNIKNATARNAVKRFVLDSFALATNEAGNVGIDLLIIVATPIIKLDLQIKSRLSQDVSEIKTLLFKTAQ